MVPDASEALTMAFVSPGWPAGGVTSGIVTYTANMWLPLMRLGARPFVLARRVEGNHLDRDVVRLDSPNSGANWLKRWASKVVGKIACKLGTRDGLVWPRLVADSVLREVRRLKRDAGLQLLQMEESRGLARYVAMRSPVPVVVRLHGPAFLVGPAAERKKGLEGRIRQEGLAIKQAHGVSTASRNTLDRARAFYRLDLKMAEVIPNAVTPVPLEDRWRLDGCDRNRILFVGRFDGLKGGDIIIEALARILLARPECELTFVGRDTGFLDDAGRRWHLEEFIKRVLPDPALRCRVQCLGPLSHSEISKLRKQSMVTVVCSRFENFPNVVLEAMAHGSPLVAPEVGGIPEMVQDGRNGLLSRPGDAADLTEKILALLGNPSLAEKLGSQGAVDCSERYDPEKLAERTIAFYRQVIERWNHRKRSIW